MVTIGIPCFNSARWLPHAIESALAQTWPGKEVIVVDDGSTDDSAAIARGYGEAIQFIPTENRGSNHARNVILQAAHGEWLQYLDADDYLEPEKIAIQFAEADDGRNADVIYSPVWWETWEAGHAVERHASALDTSRDLYLQWFAWELPQTGGALWRKSALDRLGGWKAGQPCCQEHELYARALRKALRFVYAPTPHAVYRQWSTQTLCRRDPRLTIEVKTLLIDEMSAWLRQQERWQPAHAATAGQACFEMARTMAGYDFDQATTYQRQRRRAGLFAMTGPAAPSAYRLFCRLVGFRAAERLARLTAPFRQRA